MVGKSKTIETQKETVTKKGTVKKERTVEEAAKKKETAKKKFAPGRRTAGEKKEMPQKRIAEGKKEMPEKRIEGRKKEMPQKRIAGEKKEMPQKRIAGGKKEMPEKRIAGRKREMPQKRIAGGKREMPEKRMAGRSELPICPAAEKCGGCVYQGMPYEIQLEKKQRYIESLLKNICPVRPIIGMENPFNYRNKVHAVFGRLYDGTILSGTYEKNSHRIVPIESCMIEDACADAIIRDTRGLLKSFKIKIYNEDSGFGLFRHVLIRRGFATGQVLVVLVAASPVFPSKNNFVKALLKLHPEITSIVLNINDKKTSMILGDREIVLYGKGYIEDVLCGRTFRISPKSFYQVNPVQTEVLYYKAIELAGLIGKERVIDAYCGIGTIGIIMSQYAGEVIGVELNPDAVRDAEANAKRNEIRNIRFFQNDAGKFMSGMAEQREKADVVFMDPPRTGSDEAFLSSVVKLNPKKIIYISCGPDTLARDLKYLVKHGYRAEEAWPVDLFPWTGHVETVCLLSKLHANQHIEVELQMDELDLTAAESKATYEEIKEYVLKQSGLKVSNLYIAQVKQKCGIIERENYNLPKSENSRQPKCPPEKEAAIREALEHFRMI